jgi:hypothetical protein
VKVSVEDTNGNVVTTDNSTKVTLALGTNPGGAGTLTGGGEVTVVNGVATYASASINKVGTGYTLAAADTTTGAGHPYNVATSSTFNITAPAILSVSINNKAGGTPGKPEAGDTIIFTYSSGLKMSSICQGSPLSDTSSGSITLNASSTTVQLTKNNGSTPIVFTSADCTLHLGNISLPVLYVQGKEGSTVTFAGSSVVWNGSNTITVTLGSTVAGSGSSTAGATTNGTFTPDTAVTDPSGNAISGTPFTWTGSANHF